jgi:hypothetical protein
MQISNFKSIQDGDRKRVIATVQWEDCDRPDQNIYIETEKVFAKDLSLNPHAFLVGCIIPAMHFGERRIFLDAEICPTLREGLETVMALMKEWTQGEYRPLNIEAKTRSVVGNLNNNSSCMVLISAVLLKEA